MHREEHFENGSKVFVTLGTDGAAVIFHHFSAKGEANPRTTNLATSKN